MDNKRKSLFHSLLFYILFFVLIFEILLFTFLLFRFEFHINNYNKVVNVSYKSENKSYYPKVCFGNTIKCVSINPINSIEIDTSKLGEYKVEYKYKYNNKELVLKQIINVVDNTKPIIYVPDNEVYICPNGKINYNGIKVVDDYDGDITNKANISVNKNTVTIDVSDEHGNKSTKRFKVDVKDDIKPQIDLNGAPDKYFVAGAIYYDEGVSVTDNCDDNLEAEIVSGVDYNKPGKYEITYKVTDSSNNSNEVKRNVTIINKEQSNKVIYLTFDDGPGPYTNKLLDILAKYNVKATFFVTNKGSDDIIKREYDEGHTVGLHTYTHDYEYVYSSESNYFEDLNNIRNRVKNITGYESNIIRFPGGSSNTISANYNKGIMSRLVNEVTNRGYFYYDWNVSSGDAGGTTSTDGVYYNVINNLRDDYSIVLQHDIKDFSVDAVERIIQYGLENGYTFKRLEASSPGSHHGVNN